MSTSLRTINVTTQERFDSSGALCTSLGWLNATVPVGFDFAGGDTLSVDATFNVASEDTLPDAFQIFADVLMVQMNGGVWNAGPYALSGDSYAIGGTITDYGDLNDSWSSAGGHTFAPTGGPLGQSQFQPPIIDGAPDFAGQGAVLITVSPTTPPTEVAGWNAVTTIAQGGLDTGATLAAGDDISLGVFLQVVPNDSDHLARSMYMSVNSMALVWIPAVGDPVSVPLDLSTTQVGFNTGGINVPGQFGPYDYNALRFVELTTPPVSSIMQDLYKVVTVPVGAKASVAINYHGRPA